MLQKTAIGLIIIFSFYNCGVPSKKTVTNNLNVENKTAMDTIDSKLRKLNRNSIQQFDPIFICEIANDLNPLGKNEVLSKIDSFYKNNRESSDNFGLFLLLRIVFEVPENTAYPEIKIGKFDIDRPQDKKAIRRFPIMISNELPFLVITDYFMGGLPESLDSHIQFYKEFGTLKKEGYKLQINYPAEKLYNDFEAEWCKNYETDKIPRGLKEFSKEQINRAIKSAANRVKNE